MLWHKSFRLRDDVGPAKARLGLAGNAAPVPLRRADETEVRSVLKGLARRHGLTVDEVARNLEGGMWSRGHCLGSMRLQWTFEKMCDGEGFSETATPQDPQSPRRRPADPWVA